jgi:23S rRNA (cytosine1962-C5)-methyltransferase
MVVLSLKPHKEKSLIRHHPWVFSGALADTAMDMASGTTVDIRSKDGHWFGRGAFSPHSQISVRIWTFDPNEPVDDNFFQIRLQQSIQRRHQLLKGCSTTALRLVNAESDGLPGLTVDQYNDYLVMQCMSAGVERWKDEIVEQLNRLVPNIGIFERSDANVRLKEGLKPLKRVASGQQPPALLEIREENVKLMVDLVNGHKTGFYLDQRENRKEILPYVAEAEVLNCFSYSGGFTLYALAGGAKHVTNVEVSLPALELLQKNLAVNGFDPSLSDSVQGDVFEVLRQFVSQRRQFDLIVLDPPKFADSRSQLMSALKGYQDINRLAFKLLKPGGLLFTFSCSGLLDPGLFQKIVADAALDAQRKVQLIKKLGQAKDHPILFSFPEGSYLKGFICQAD